MRKIIPHGAVFDDALTGFALATREVPVLTVWISGGLRNPADRHAWAVALRNGVAECRAALSGAPTVESDEFDAAVRAVEARTPSSEDVHATPGMVILGTGHGDVLVRPVRLTPAASVTWQVGAHLAPWMTFGPRPPAIVAVADRQHATLHRLEQHTLSEAERHATEPTVEPASHMGAAPKQGFHTGTRGETQRDAAARRLRELRARHAVKVAERIAVLAGNDQDVAIGGVRETADLVARALPGAFAGRVARFGSARANADAARVLEDARLALLALESSRQRRLVSDLIDGAGPAGSAAVGLADVVRALQGDAADHVVVSPALVARQPQAADRLVLDALAHRTAIEVAHEPIAAMLDARAGGIAARLRFTMPPVPDAPRATQHDRPHRRHEGAPA